MYHGTYISLIYLISSESILSDEPLMRVFYPGGRGIILDVGWDSLDLMPKVRYIHLRIVSYRNDLIALVYMDD